MARESPARDKHTGSSSLPRLVVLYHLVGGLTASATGLLCVLVRHFSAIAAALCSAL
jgi:hypothetical protein